MRSLSSRKLFLLGFIILAMGTFLPACTGIPKDTRPYVYISSDGSAWTMNTQNLATRIYVIPENAIVTRYVPYSERLKKDEY